MKSEIICIQLSLVLGLLVHWSDGKAFDMDSIKESMEMAAMNAAGIALEMADNMKANGGFNGAFAFGSSHSSSSSEEDRKRRRRSSDDAELNRQKRSPCGRRRVMQTTPATPANAAGGDDNTDDQDLPRRHRRSPDNNDIDENVDVIPAPRKFEENIQELSEKIHQVMKRAFETMQGMLQAIGNNIRRTVNNEAQEPTEK